MRVRRVFRRASVLVLAASPVVAAETVEPAPKRAFGLEDLYRVVTLEGIDREPPGSALVYSVRRTDLPRAEANRDLYRLSPRDGESRRLTWTANVSESSPVWSPDGAHIAFVARRGEQAHDQIWLLPAESGEARPLTDLPTDASHPVWSPDGRHIAFTARVFPDCGTDRACHETKETRRAEGPLRARVADDLLYRHWNAWSEGKVTHVLLVEVETGAVRDLTPGPREAPAFSLGSSRGFAFSPDGRELCFTRNPDSAKTLAWSTNSDLWVVPVEPDPQGPRAEPLNLTSDNLAWDGDPAYSPDGRYIAYRRQSRPGYEADRFRLAVVDRRTGASRVLTDGFEDWVLSFRWLPDGSGLVFKAPVEGRTPLFRVGAEGGPARRIASFSYIDDFVLSADGNAAYLIGRSVDRPHELWRLDLTGDGEPRRLTHHNLALEREVDLRPAESFWVDTTDGRRVQVFVVKPHGFDPTQRYPLILNVHGGPQMMWADAFRGDWQVYPGAGYVVAFANPRGSTGYGQAFTERISGDWGGRVFADLMEVTDALEALPWIDGDRMGAMGWSYGGYMMNWFQGHTRRFRALAGMMGLMDLRSFYLTTEELWFPEWDLGGPPWRSKLYERWNPAAFIENFRTPMLVITGEKDFRVPYTQGLMTFTALRRRGVPARLIVLPEAGHWPGWYEMALYYTAHLHWFHRFLGGDPAPWSVEGFADNAVFDPDTGERIDGAGE